METVTHQDKWTLKEYAHVQTERTTCLKEMNAYAQNTPHSGTANTVQDVPQEWISILTLASATSAQKDSFEDIK